MGSVRFLHIKSFIDKIENCTIKIITLGSAHFPEDSGSELIRETVPTLRYLDETLGFVSKLTDVFPWKIRKI